MGTRTRRMLNDASCYSQSHCTCLLWAIGILYEWVDHVCSHSLGKTTVLIGTKSLRMNHQSNWWGLAWALSRSPGAVKRTERQTLYLSLFIIPNPRYMDCPFYQKGCYTNTYLAILNDSFKLSSHAERTVTWSYRPRASWKEPWAYLLPIKLQWTVGKPQTARMIAGVSIWHLWLQSNPKPQSILLTENRPIFDEKSTHAP